MTGPDKEAYRQFLDKYYEDLYAVGADNNRNQHATDALISYFKREYEDNSSHICLDIGFGRGALLRYFSQRGWFSVGVEIARSPYQEGLEQTHNINIQYCGFQEFESERLFSIIVDNGTFHHQHPSDRSMYLHKISRLMTQDGSFLLTTYYSKSSDDNTTEIIDDGRFKVAFDERLLSNMLAIECPDLRLEAHEKIQRPDRDQDCILFVIRHRNDTA